MYSTTLIAVFTAALQVENMNNEQKTSFYNDGDNMVVEIIYMKIVMIMTAVIINCDNNDDKRFFLQTLCSVKSVKFCLLHFLFPLKAFSIVFDAQIFSKSSSYCAQRSHEHIEINKIIKVINFKENRRKHQHAVLSMPSECEPGEQ
uniref:Uncharacterized protein n=1 Tax=Glossina palpalis gambiensis TaxID=67801 RepID=A0A1B0AZ56_9MUSC